MEPVKPASSNSSRLGRTITKVLRLRAAGIAPDDGIRKEKLPESKETPSLHSRSFDIEKKMRNREALEAFLAKLFASVSAIKASYAQLQIAQSPYDAESIQSADEVVISELKSLSELKHSYMKKQIVFPSRESQLVAEIREQKNLIKTYEIIKKKFESQLQLKDSEIIFLEEKLQELNTENRVLEKRLNPNGSLAALDHLHISGLNPSHFILVLRHTVKSIRNFVKLMTEQMEFAGWDLNAAASSIEGDVVYPITNYRCFAFESFVCQKMFEDFQNPNFSLLSESRQRQRYYFERFTEMKSIEPKEYLIKKRNSAFGKFCKMKYLSLVHPKMEASFFGNLDQRNLVNSGEFPDTDFFAAFAEIAKRVWLLHYLAFSFEPEAFIFQVRKGCPYSEVYMESAVEDATIFLADDTRDTRPTVGFTVIPGFKIGKTVIQCKVYLLWRNSKSDIQ